MNPDLNAVLDAAMKLPPDQRRELIIKLSCSTTTSKTPGAVRKHFGSISSGDPNSADNEKIDAELAKSYLETHEFEN